MRTALVLSAGGMFGAWQAGAWQELERVFKPDIIVAASAGALNGWSIAGGAAGDELAANWLQPQSANAAALRTTAHELIARYHPRIPFSLQLTEWPRLQVRLFPGESVTWRHLVATCSIPVLFPPVRIDGKLYVDGGLTGALPLWAAQHLGASRIVALDCLPRLPSRFLHAGATLLNRLAPQRPPVTIPVLRIMPGRELGNLRSSLRWSYENVELFLRQGRNDVKSWICRISEFIG